MKTMHMNGGLFILEYVHTMRIQNLDLSVEAVWDHHVKLFLKAT